MECPTFESKQPDNSCAGKLFYRLIIPGQLPDFNRAIERAKAGNVAKRSGSGKRIFANPYQDWKKKVDEGICWQIKDQLRGVKLNTRCAFVFKWYDKDRMRDPDNIAFATKFIFDAMQIAGVLVNDGWKQTAGGFMHLFGVDQVKPRVEIFILPGGMFEFNEYDF